MDAKVDGWVVTPRIGKPVEINALWYNGLCLMAGFARLLGRPHETYTAAAEKARLCFDRFWNPERGYCLDVSAHLRVYQDPAQARSFLAPFFHHLSEAGLGSLSEIFDGDPPFTPEGCFAQAWSVAEVLRVLDEIANFNENRLTLKK